MTFAEALNVGPPVALAVRRAVETFATLQTSLPPLRPRLIALTIVFTIVAKTATLAAFLCAEKCERERAFSNEALPRPGACR